MYPNPKNNTQNTNKVDREPSHDATNVMLDKNPNSKLGGKVESQSMYQSTDGFDTPKNDVVSVSSEIVDYETPETNPFLHKNCSFAENSEGDHPHELLQQIYGPRTKSIIEQLCDDPCRRSKHNIFLTSKQLTEADYPSLLPFARLTINNDVRPVSNLKFYPDFIHLEMLATMQHSNSSTSCLRCKIELQYVCHHPEYKFLLTPHHHILPVLKKALPGGDYAPLNYGEYFQELHARTKHTMYNKCLKCALELSMTRSPTEFDITFFAHSRDDEMYPQPDYQPIISVVDTLPNRPKIPKRIKPVRSPNYIPFPNNHTLQTCYIPQVTGTMSRGWFSNTITNATPVYYSIYLTATLGCYGDPQTFGNFNPLAYLLLYLSDTGGAGPPENEIPWDTLYPYLTQYATESASQNPLYQMIPLSFNQRNELFVSWVIPTNYHLKCDFGLPNEFHNFTSMFIVVETIRSTTPMTLKQFKAATAKQYVIEKNPGPTFYDPLTEFATNARPTIEAICLGDELPAIWRDSENYFDKLKELVDVEIQESEKSKEPYNLDFKPMKPLLELSEEEKLLRKQKSPPKTKKKEEPSVASRNILTPEQKHKKKQFVYHRLISKLNSSPEKLLNWILNHPKYMERRTLTPFVKTLVAKIYPILDPTIDAHLAIIALFTRDYAIDEKTRLAPLAFYDFINETPLEERKSFANIYAGSYDQVLSKFYHQIGRLDCFSNGVDHLINGGVRLIDIETNPGPNHLKNKGVLLVGIELNPGPSSNIIMVNQNLKMSDISSLPDLTSQVIKESYFRNGDYPYDQYFSATSGLPVNTNVGEYSSADATINTMDWVDTTNTLVKGQAMELPEWWLIGVNAGAGGNGAPFLLRSWTAIDTQMYRGQILSITPIYTSIINSTSVGVIARDSNKILPNGFDLLSCAKLVPSFSINGLNMDQFLIKALCYLLDANMRISNTFNQNVDLPWDGTLKSEINTWEEVGNGLQAPAMTFNPDISQNNCGNITNNVTIANLPFNNTGTLRVVVDLDAVPHDYRNRVWCLPQNFKNSRNPAMVIAMMVMCVCSYPSVPYVMDINIESAGFNQTHAFVPWWQQNYIPGQNDIYIWCPREDPDNVDTPQQAAQNSYFPFTVGSTQVAGFGAPLTPLQFTVPGQDYPYDMGSFIASWYSDVGQSDWLDWIKNSAIFTGSKLSNLSYVAEVLASSVRYNPLIFGNSVGCPVFNDVFDLNTQTKTTGVLKHYLTEYNGVVDISTLKAPQSYCSIGQTSNIAWNQLCFGTHAVESLSDFTSLPSWMASNKIIYNLILVGRSLTAGSDTFYKIINASIDLWNQALTGNGAPTAFHALYSSMWTSGSKIGGNEVDNTAWKIPTVQVMNTFFTRCVSTGYVGLTLHPTATTMVITPDGKSVSEVPMCFTHTLTPQKDGWTTMLIGIDNERTGVPIPITLNDYFYSTGTPIISVETAMFPCSYLTHDNLSGLAVNKGFRSLVILPQQYEAVSLLPEHVADYHPNVYSKQYLNSYERWNERVIYHQNDNSTCLLTYRNGVAATTNYTTRGVAGVILPGNYPQQVVKLAVPTSPTRLSRGMVRATSQWIPEVSVNGLNIYVSYPIINNRQYMYIQYGSAVTQVSRPVLNGTIVAPQGLYIQEYDNDYSRFMGSSPEKLDEGND